MRSMISVIALAAMLLLASCGASDTTAQLPTATAAQQAAGATATAQPATPPSAATPAQPEPMQETTMPTQPPATPAEQPSPEQPTEPPAAPRPTFRASPIAQVPTSPPAQAAQPTPALDPALAPQVNSAKADLAGRQSVPVDAVGLVEVRSVVWPDRSLGCPRPGMVYPQVQVEGLLIRLSIGDRVFEYHGGGDKPPFLCEQKP